MPATNVEHNVDVMMCHVLQRIFQVETLWLLKTVAKCLSSVSIVSHNSVCPCPKESEAYAAFVTAVGRGRPLILLGLTRVLHVLAAVLLDLLHTMKSV